MFATFNFRVGTRGAVALAAIVCLSNLAVAEVVQVSVEGVFDSTANLDLPMTAPDGTVNYSFEVDTAAATPFGSNSFNFSNVAFDYTLNGNLTNLIAPIVRFSNPGSATDNARILVLTDPQVNLNLPTMDLFYEVEGDIFLMDKRINFDGGFVGPDGNDRFRGTVTIGNPPAVPEPSSAIACVFGLGFVALRRRRLA